MLSEFPEYSTESVLNVTILLPNISTSVSGALSVWGPRRDPLYVVIPVTILYSLIFITGLVGNISTCIVIARNRHMHTATNYYLFSLAISDLLLLISGLPPEMYYIWSKYPYIFGESFCRLTGLTAETSMNATVLTITAFTVERYVAICHPFLTHTVSKLSRAIKFVIAIWFIALFCAVPQAIQFGLVYETNKAGEKVSEELKTCSVKNRLTYSFELSTVFFFFAPMSVITVLYILIGIRLHRAGDRRPDGLRGSRRGHGKSTRRVVKMLVVVVIAFFICWAPFQAQRLFAVHGSPTDSTTVLIYQTITYTSGLLYYLSTTVNPFLYNIMSHKFREAFKSTLSRCLSGKEAMRSELCGGSSEGRGPRFNYSVLSHRSVRANQSLSSGHSYIEQVDLNKRPLVVSFRKKDNAELNSNHLSEPPASPEKRELLEIPRYENGNCQRKILVRSYVPRLSPKTKEKRSSSPRIPRIEDIEIFQESQLRITMRKKEDSSCPEYRKKEDDVNLVKKSYTVPCLVMN